MMNNNTNNEGESKEQLPVATPDRMPPRSPQMMIPSTRMPLLLESSASGSVAMTAVPSATDQVAVAAAADEDDDDDDDDATATAAAVKTLTSPLKYPLSASDRDALALLSSSKPPSLSRMLTGGGVWSPELLALLDSAPCHWNLDIFQLCELSGFRPLSTLSLWCVTRHGVLGPFVRDMGMDLGQVMGLMTAVEAGYDWANPYHNALHGADVLQNVLYLLSSDLLSSVMTPLDYLVFLLAAAVHDLGHPGLTNGYLVDTGHPLADRYNDQSVLENHSVSELFRLLRQQGAAAEGGAPMGFLDVLPREAQRDLRASLTSMVLHTDMRRHTANVSALEDAVQKKRNASPAGWFSRDNKEDRKTLRDFVLHVADLGNPAKPLSLSRHWTDLIINEYYQQGDKEREKGIPISPMVRILLRLTKRHRVRTYSRFSGRVN
jgi:cAMP-specific phosphodiesterase 4